MKFKLIAAITAAFVMAVGMSFGQDVESGIYYSDFFDTYSVGDTISNMNEVVKANMQTTSYLGTWSSGEADMTKIANDGGNKYLALDTAGDVVTNTLISADEINDVLSGGGEVSFATQMKLIPSDEIESSFVDAFDAEGNPAIVDNGDLKFGLYAYEYDVTKTVDGDEVVDVVTNLVVYHSYYKYDSTTGKTGIGYTNNVIELKDSNGNPISFAGEITVVTTLKMLANELYFSVSIPGSADEITSSLGCTDDAFTEEKLDITSCPSVDGGKWFRCVYKYGNNSTISALNLSGTGNVRGIELSAVEGEGGGEGGDTTNLTYPDNSEITDTALVAWLAGKNATQAQIDNLGSVAALNEKYLLNLDLENSFYSLKIKSLTVGDDVKVEVDLVRSNATAEVSAAINGKLQLWGTADLGTDFEVCGDVTEISNDDFSEGTTAVKSFTPAAGVKFFKAVIVAPTAAE